MTVVKRAGTREPFDREKVAAGVLAAAKGRPLTADDATELAAQVEDEMRLDGGEVTSERVGRVVLDLLRGARSRSRRCASRASTRGSTTSPTSSARSRCSPSAPSPSTADSSPHVPAEERAVVFEQVRELQLHDPTRARPTMIRSDAPPTRSGETVRHSSSIRPAVASAPLSTGPPSQVTTRMPSTRSCSSPAVRSTPSVAGDDDLRDLGERGARRGIACLAGQDDRRLDRVREHLQVAIEIETPAHDDDPRSLLQTVLDAARALPVVEARWSVALGAHGPGTDEHRVAARPQRVEHLAVRRVC